MIEFGVMTLDEDRYSSICCFVGTNLGKVITFKLLPSQNGTYSVQLAGVVAFDDKIVALCPIETNTGRPAAATGQIVASLREGRTVDGALVAGKLSVFSNRGRDNFYVSGYVFNH